MVLLVLYCLLLLVSYYFVFHLNGFSISIVGVLSYFALIVISHCIVGAEEMLFCLSF